MGCVSSKQTVSVTPAIDYSGENGKPIDFGISQGSCIIREIEKTKNRKKKRTESGVSECDLTHLGESGRTSSISESVSSSIQKYVEAEQVATGWPSWLTAVAGEAIHGWAAPLNADSFEKLEKIGQGTYSSVFKAREIQTGKIFALKKVRFDNFDPESVRFMAREINILRKLDHPNVIKLEGLIASRLSCSLYLVFEYMDHDIAGLISNPDCSFTESQVKCFMKQFLMGIEHCHSKGVMHRDIKGANLLVNDEGILKVADFGLANFCNSSTFDGLKQPLTSRVVTLWYRPPELLLGSTEYGSAVDLWSVGCVFAEILLGKPILQGRTEVEQLHKIFKLCGSPSKDYWKISKLPHATLFKPQQPYESSLWETCKDLPKPAVKLIETLLSVESHKRGTATSALASEYFSTKPYACDPSSFPKYPPCKEIDSKNREENNTMKWPPIERGRGSDGSRMLTRRKPTGTNKLTAAAPPPPPAKAQGRRLGGYKEEASSNASSQGGDVPFSGPLEISGSSGFAWAKRRLDDSSSSRSLFECRTNYSREEESYERISHSLLKQWSQLDRNRDSFDTSDEYHSQELPVVVYKRDRSIDKRINVVYEDERDKVEFSGPILSQLHKVDELLARHDRQIRHAIRKSWFQRGNKQE